MPRPLLSQHKIAAVTTGINDSKSHDNITKDWRPTHNYKINETNHRVSADMGQGRSGVGSWAESLKEAGKSGTFHTQVLFDAFPAPLRDLGTRMTARPNE